MKFSGYKHTAVKVINVFFYVFAMPGVIAWSVLGVLWQAGDAFECIPEDMVPWSFLLWLGITILTGLTMIICLVYDLVELRRLNRYMQKIEENSASNTKSLIGRTN